MSQSSTLIRVAKRALDSTAIYSDYGQNIIYYQPFDFSIKSDDYTIQRSNEYLGSMASY
jgi:hypothetical protein